MGVSVSKLAGISLSVVGARTATPHHVGAFLPRRGDGPENNDLFDDARADLLGDATLDGGQQELELFGPGGGVGAHDELVALEGLDARVVGVAGAHDVPPFRHDGPHFGGRVPFAHLDGARQNRAQRVDPAVARPHGGHAGGSAPRVFGSRQGLAQRAPS
mgnify:CR=1 FL=1